MHNTLRRMIPLAIIVLLLATLLAVASAQDTDALYTGHFILPEEGIYPEGIAYSAALKAFFVGSAVDGTILRGDLETGEVAVFIESGRDGNTSVTGMKLDDAGRLWVSGAETGKIFIYEAATGDLMATYQVPPAPVMMVGFFTNGAEVPANLVNDVTIADNGDAYFTDSYSDLIYRIPVVDGEPGELEVWLTELGGGFINGIAITPDNNYLLIALAEAGGLRRVEIATQEISAVDLGDGVLIPDGLLFDSEDAMSLYATNFPGDGSASVARVTFTADDYSVGVVEPAFVTDDTFAVATTIAQVDDRLLVVNSQMFTYFDPSVDPVRPWVIANVAIPQE